MLTFLRTISKSFRRQSLPLVPHRTMSISCRGKYSSFCNVFLTLLKGKPISANELFNYSNGRFLVNEQFELSRRHVTFDVNSLCALVSSLPCIMSPVSSIDKQEGGFNKALIVTTANNRQVVVKIPFPHLVPARYSVESEVATLKLGMDSRISLTYVSNKCRRQFAI